MTRPILIIAALALALLPAATAPGSPSRTAQKAPADTTGNNTLLEVTGPVLYQSVAGDFEVTFPPGCATYRERLMDLDAVPEEHEPVVMTVYTFCDRKGRANEGCSVAAYVDQDLDTGQPADPGFVLQRVQAVLKQYGAEVLQQKPYRSQLADGPLLEGVDVLAADQGRAGQIWVRGLLVEGDVYILVAWRAHGQLHADPEIVDFFESFRAHM